MAATLDQLNAGDRAAFTAALGHLFEHSPWVAEETWADRPFRDAAHLHAALCARLRAAPRERQLALIRAHPDLAGRLARSRQLTAESAREQSSAGLDRLSAEELAAFVRLNAAYTGKFGFPFIICARLNAKDAIVEAMRRRLDNDAPAEFEAALGEIAKIAGLRLADTLPPRNLPPMPAKLSTHVLDLTTGRPAAGMRIELWSLAGPPRPVTATVTNADGRTDAPLLAGETMAAGAYELVFFARDYFAARGVACDFLDRVPVRFTITDAAASHHVPLLLTPWAYQTYRGS